MRGYPGQKGYVPSQIGGGRRGLAMPAEQNVLERDTLGTPIARQIQGGVTVKRLPDVAFQPESALPLTFTANTSTCNLYEFDTNTGGYVTVLEYTVPKGRKLIIDDAKIVWSNMFMPGICVAVFMVDGRQFGDQTAIEVPQNPPCGCKLKIRLVINENQKFGMYIRRLADGWDSGKIVASASGWLVFDMFPMDERMQK